MAEANVGGYYTGMFIIGFIMIFFALANLAVGIGNAVVCGMLGSVGYGIWGSVFVSKTNKASLGCILYHNHACDKRFDSSFR